MTRPEATTQRAGQHAPVLQRLDSTFDALKHAEVARAAESEQTLVAQSHHVLPLVSYTQQCMSLNRQAGAPVKYAGRRNFWRSLGYALYRGLRSPEHRLVSPVAVPESPMRVVVTYGFSDRNVGAREAINLSQMTKAIVDGLVDAGLAADDSEVYITGQDSRLLQAKTPKGQVWVIVSVMGHAD